MLIEKGANINAVDDENQSPIFYAANNGELTNAFTVFFSNNQ